MHLTCAKCTAADLLSGMLSENAVSQTHSINDEKSVYLYPSLNEEDGCLYYMQFRVSSL